MNKVELIQRLGDIEWEDFEVKEARTAVPKSSWETVSSFSNTNGGWIVFGVKQNGKNFEITGVNNPEKIEQDFLTTLNGEKFNIKISPKSERYRIEDKTVLSFYIPLSKQKPVYYNNLSNTFIRQGSSDRKAQKAEIDAMFRDSSYGTKTTEVISGSSIKYLNQRTISNYRDYMTRFNPDSFYNRVSDTEFLRRTQIIIDGEVTYAGLLMFGKREFIDLVFVDFRIDLLEIPADSYANANPRYTFKLDEQENIWEYYFTLFDRIRTKIDVPFKMSVEGFAIGDSLPLKALREALVNMLTHADYFSPAKPRVRVFTDRLEYFNPGGLPKPLKELMETDVSLPRNPVLAKLFRSVKLAESAGFGFDKIMLGWKEYNTKQPPLFNPSFDYTILTFYLLKTENPNTYQSKEKSKEKSREKSKEKILKLIMKNSRITIKELSDKIGLSVAGIEKNIKILKESGLLRRVGPDKGGYWEIVTDEEKS